MPVWMARRLSGVGSPCSPGAGLTQSGGRPSAAESSGAPARPRPRRVGGPGLSEPRLRAASLPSLLPVPGPTPSPGFFCFHVSPLFLLQRKGMDGGKSGGGRTGRDWAVFSPRPGIRVSVRPGGLSAITLFSCRKSISQKTPERLPQRLPCSASSALPGGCHCCTKVPSPCGAGCCRERDWGHAGPGDTSRVNE